MANKVKMDYRILDTPQAVMTGGCINMRISRVNFISPTFQVSGLKWPHSTITFNIGIGIGNGHGRSPC